MSFRRMCFARMLRECPMDEGELIREGNWRCEELIGLAK